MTPQPAERLPLPFETGVPRRTRILFLVSAPFLVVVVLAPLVAVLTLGPPTPVVLAVTLLLGLPAVGAGIWLLRRVLRSLSGVVRVTEDGLQYECTGEMPVFLPWKSVASVRERPIWQRLEVVGQGGNPVIHVEYQVDDFERLRREILVQTRENTPVELPLHIKGSSHLVNVLSVIGLAAGLVAAGMTSPEFLIIGFFLLPLFALELWRMSVGVTADEEAVEVRYLFRKRRHAWRDIDDIVFDDTFNRGQRIARLALVVGGKRIALGGLRGSATDNWMRLYSAWLVQRGEASNPTGA